ncbi:hypothetical protein ACB094_02G174100 [Castanea mollissima]
MTSLTLMLTLLLKILWKIVVKHYSSRSSDVYIKHMPCNSMWRHERKLTLLLIFEYWPDWVFRFNHASS